MRTSSRLAAIVAVAAVGAAGIAPAAAHASPAPASSGVTVSGPHMYDPQTKTQYPQASTVTIRQTTRLVNQFVTVSWTNFTPSNSRGGPHVYSPAITLYPVEVSQCAGTDPASLSDCYGAAQDLEQTFAPNGPTTAVYALTAKNGTGTDTLQIETGLQNSSLRCSAVRACSLLILPVDGGDPGVPPKTPPDCTDHQRDASTQQATMAGIVQSEAGGPLDTCAWQDRIVVPLHFAKTPANCKMSHTAFSAAGSPMLQRAMTSWLTGLCLGQNPLGVSYDTSFSEATARQFFLDGSEDVALTTDPADATGVHPYTYAPVGITAAALAYWMDNPRTGQPYTDLRMTARLVTKLITTSYNYQQYACTPKDPDPPPPGCNEAVEHNPESLFRDPDFKAINPGIRGSVDPDFSDFPTLLAGNSDMTDEVTRWIGANLAASSFLASWPDPWGMRVNINYQGEQFPEDEFTAQDPFEAWNHSFMPQFPLSKVVSYQAFNWDPGISIQPVVVVGGPPTYPPNAAEVPGTRDLEAILDLADATADQMPVAALQNHEGDFVLPSSQSMRAAVQDMITNQDGITQDDNENAINLDAYPWTMVVYAMVPTAGISHRKAVAIARWLDYVAGPGQVSGTTPGQLPGGYLPLDARQRAQTLKAAREVLHQTGTQPPGGDASHN
jgi:hypothetical protein